MRDFVFQFSVNTQKKFIFSEGDDINYAAKYKAFIELQIKEIIDLLIKTAESIGQPPNKLTITYTRDFTQQIKSFEIVVEGVPKECVIAIVNGVPKDIVDLLNDAISTRFVNTRCIGGLVADHIKLTAFSEKDNNPDPGLASAPPPSIIGQNKSLLFSTPIAVTHSRDYFGNLLASTYSFSH